MYASFDSLNNYTIYLPLFQKWSQQMAVIAKLPDCAFNDAEQSCWLAKLCSEHMGYSSLALSVAVLRVLFKILGTKHCFIQNFRDETNNYCDYGDIPNFFVYDINTDTQTKLNGNIPEWTSQGIFFVWFCYCVIVFMTIVFRLRFIFVGVIA